MSYSRVREALVASVACTLPPVSFQITQVSIVPASSSPLAAASRAPGTWDNSHASFVPEK